MDKPYLSTDEVGDRLRILGFEFEKVTYGGIPFERMVDTAEGRKRITALEEIIAGAIASWANVELSDDTRIGQVDAELREWAEEYLLG